MTARSPHPFSFAHFLLTFLLAIPAVALGAPGDLDPSFAAAGVLRTTEYDGGPASGYAVAIQADGKIVVGGYAQNGVPFDPVLARLNVDGSLDTTFASGGYFRISAGSRSAEIVAIAIRRDGTIFAAGVQKALRPAAPENSFVLRLDAQGRLDTSFGSAGIATVGPVVAGSPLTAVNRVLIQSDGNIVVAGTAVVGNRGDAFVARLQANGALDGGFGTNGYARTGLAGYIWGNDAAFAPDGAILVAGAADLPDGGGGYRPRAGIVMRVLPTGERDPGYGSGGVASLPQSFGASEARGIALQADGKSILVGNAGNFNATFRLLPSGGIDTAYGNGGQAPFGSSSQGRAERVRVLPDGRALALRVENDFVRLTRIDAQGTVDSGFAAPSQAMTAGFQSTTVLRSTELALAGEFPVIVSGNRSSADELRTYRLSPNGAFDTSFAVGGVSSLKAGLKPLESSFSWPALWPSSEISVARRALPTEPAGVALLRLTADGRRHPSFGQSGIVHLSASSPDVPAALVPLPDGKLLMALERPGSGPVVVRRINADGTEDASFQAPSLGSPDELVERFAGLAVYPDGRFVLVNEKRARRYLASGCQGVVLPGGCPDPSFNGGQVLSPPQGAWQRAALTADGGLLLVQGSYYISPSPLVVRKYDSSGRPDTSFGFAGAAHLEGLGNVSIRGLQVQPDGKILLAGYPTPWVMRLQADGTPDSTFGQGGLMRLPGLAAGAEASGLALQASGKILVSGNDARDGGGNPTTAWVMRLNADGSMDGTFASGGTLRLDTTLQNSANFVGLQANGRIIVGGYASGPALWGLVGETSTSIAPTTTALASSANPSTDGQPVTFTATVTSGTGTPTGGVSFIDGSTTLCGNVALASGSAQCTTSGLSVGSHSISAQYAGNASFAASTSPTLTQTVQSPPAGTLSLSTNAIDFGGQSMGTTSSARTITVANTGPGPLSISAISVSAQFVQSSNCATLAAGTSCQILAAFSPAAASGPLNSSVGVSGFLQVTSNAANSPNTVALAGSAEKSLVVHYYGSILGRHPDSAGKTFWQNEAARLASLGANPNEAWYAMAAAFYSSAEYASFNRSDSGFVDDLYDTFFNRVADSAGLAYWTDQLSRGLPRDAVLAAFMLSEEFANFSQAIFGPTQVAPEIDLVMDFYRGLLARLPDDAGFNHWVGRFRTARCAGAVENEARSIAGAFIASAEYANRARSHAQFVADLYNAVMRRGADLAGLQHWVSRLQSGAMTREAALEQFVASQEFQARVARIAARGC